MPETRIKPRIELYCDELAGVTLDIQNMAFTSRFNDAIVKDTKPNKKEMVRVTKLIELLSYLTSYGNHACGLSRYRAKDLKSRDAKQTMIRCGQKVRHRTRNFATSVLTSMGVKMDYINKSMPSSVCKVTKDTPSSVALHTAACNIARLYFEIDGHRDDVIERLASSAWEFVRDTYFFLAQNAESRLVIPNPQIAAWSKRVQITAVPNFIAPRNSSQGQRCIADGAARDFAKKIVPVFESHEEAAELDVGKLYVYRNILHKTTPVDIENQVYL